MLEQVSPSIWMWSEIHGEARGEAYPWNSYLIRIPDEEEIVLVDPLPMSSEELSYVEQTGIPTYIVLTCEYHLRHSEEWRKRWGCKILANEVETLRYQIRLDGIFRDGQTLWNFIDAIYIPDLYFPETALRIREMGGVMITGDLFSGGRKDLGIPEGKLAVTAPNYISDLSRARKSLHTLLDFPFELMLFGHGYPVRDNPKRKMETYLQDDKIWEELGQEQRRKPRQKAI